ncbi:laccase [Dendrothele bispora CBS 962.96]|uniref:Laccase n=1 Tax=Dendrothele bispora (strain CBS 962.96) TaxID=1314807 RepID=A0A4S8LI29_DENBC|nr:laccase [Dendrothele bispora CBS 962.96]
MLLSLVLITGYLSSVYGLEVIKNQGDIHVVNKRLAPDGFLRDTIAAGVLADSVNTPGPIITGNKGDRFTLNVIDELVDTSMPTSTSIHWHGLFQHTTNWADGPSGVNQCPIAANNSFTYDFQVPGQAGTFWWHSHFRTQYCDGLRGPFVVYDPEDPHADLYDVDDENTIITLADWFHINTNTLVMTPGAPMSNSTLINGVGRYPNGPNVSLAVINVEQGKRYRMRLISMSCDSNFMFSIDGHDMTVIEADGISTEPVTVNTLQIFAAQRYSFVLNANQPVDNYRIRAQPPNATSLSIGFKDGINSAILRYKGAPDSEPTTSPPQDVVLLNDAQLAPLENPGAPGGHFPGGADYTLNLTLGFQVGATGIAEFLMNGTQFVPPNVPVLLQILSGTQRAQDLLPTGSVYGLPLNKSIEINLFGNGTPGGPHPFHLHGHAFDVVKGFDMSEPNYENPVRRDTTPVNGANVTTIRFRTDNPGPWFLHCHIDFHLDLGLAVVLAEDIPDIKSVNPAPEEWFKLCDDVSNQ